MQIPQGEEALHSLVFTMYSDFLPKSDIWEGRKKKQIYGGETWQTSPQPGNQG